MKVKRFHGANSREVLRQVRQALGPDAIILSNRNVPTGVEILAVAERDMASIVGMQTMPASQAVDEEELEVRRVLFEGKNESTKRRVNHELPIGSSRASADKAAAGRAAGRPAASESQLHAERADAELVAELKSLRAEFQQKVEMLMRAAQAQKALADRNLAAANARLAAEIGTLRKLVERELGGLAWSEMTRQRPARAEAVRRGLNAGFSPALARELGDAVPAEVTEREVPKWLAATLEQRLVVADMDSIIDRGGVYALVGPTGVGKTTTIAKLAARYAMKHGVKRLALISMDTYRIGAQDHLRAYGRILGVPVHTAHDADALRDVLVAIGNKHLVLIDTPGLGQRDDRVAEQRQSLMANNVQRLLVLNAASQAEALEDVVAVHRAGGLAGCLLTKIDEAVKLGSALDVLVRHRLPLHYVANGQRVPEDLHLPNRAYLIHRALRTAPAAPYVLRDEEIGFAAVGAPRELQPVPAAS
ncbi:MAG: flagellar biosynthesis protein FlhF [Burkholderiales bacterium]|nr:flagellar biosynthesis protein FlhF [Burkholderiales bacterium]